MKIFFFHEAIFIFNGGATNQVVLHSAKLGYIVDETHSRTERIYVEQSAK
jgi:hypothetical protein